jgi:hypothetical protein
VVLTLSGSKTDQLGTSTTRMLSRSKFDSRCPVKAAWAMKQIALSLGSDQDTPLAAWGRNKFITTENLCDVVKKAAIAVGSDPADYSCHSFRAGGATSMLEANIDYAIIKQFGRWLSDCFLRYTHLTPRVCNGIIGKIDRLAAINSFREMY